MNIKDATNEALDAIVRRAGSAMRENNRTRLQSIAQEVSDYIPPTPRPRSSPKASAEAATMFAQVLRDKGLR